MNNIKYILWDIDRTLIDFNKAEALALKECFKKYGLCEFTDEMLEEYKVINDKYWKMLERGEISKQEVLEGRFREFFTPYSIDLSIIPKFNKDYQMTMGDIACFIDNGEEVVKYLKNKYKQYAVTNGTALAQYKKLSKSGLDKLLDGVFISEEMGYDKPSKEFFDIVFKTIGSDKKEEYLIVGDSLTSDMLGGVNAGIKTCWFNPEYKTNDKNLRIDFEIHNLKELLEII